VLLQLRSERLNSQGAPISSSDDSESEEEQSDASESELDLDSYYFLQVWLVRDPLSQKCCKEHLKNIFEM
jgi:cysteine/serine-rich nuclear protein